MATTVRDVAREAGVSVPTVYAAYRNKAGLVRALADAADLTAELPRLLDELEATSAPTAQPAAMAGGHAAAGAEPGRAVTTSGGP